MNQMRGSTDMRQIDAFVVSEEGRDAVGQLMRAAGRPQGATVQTGTLETVSRLAGIATFSEVMILELGSAPLQEALEAVAYIVEEGTDLVLLGRQNDVATYRAFLAAGVKDYLVLPLPSDSAPPAVLIAQGNAQSARPKSGRAIAICGVSGGVGASLMAANLCVALQGEKPKRGAVPDRKIGLLDADLAFGSLAVDLDIEATQGMLEAFANMSRVDSTFLQATMHQSQMGFSVYAAEVNDPDKLTQFEQGFLGLIERLKDAFSITVIDFPSRFLAQSNPALEAIDDLILVLSPGFNSVRAAGRLLEHLQRRAAPPRIWYVLSQTRRDAGLSAKEIATALEAEISVTLPLCGRDIARASLKGVPLLSIAPRGDYARRVREFARKLEHVDEVPRQSPELFSLWRSKKRG